LGKREIYINQFKSSSFLSCAGQVFTGFTVISRRTPKKLFYKHKQTFAKMLTIIWKTKINITIKEIKSNFSRQHSAGMGKPFEPGAILAFEI